MQQGLPTEKHYNVTHYQQRFNWDCGISCVLMILTTTQRQDFLENFNKICEDEGFGASTWTIDLCYILKKFGVRHEYFTKTLGVDPNYNQHSYYTKIIDKDEKRIEKKFSEAKTHGLYVEQRTVEMLELLEHMAKHGPVILLTNASLLTCEVCKPNVLDKVRYVGFVLFLNVLHCHF